MIEKNGDAQPLWWAGGASWSGESDTAIHFERREDAMRVLVNDSSFIGGVCDVTEHQDVDNVARLPVRHQDIGVRLIEAIKETPNIQAGVFIAIDADLRSTRTVLHSTNATLAHIGLVIADMEVVKHRLLVMSDDEQSVEEIVDEDDES